MQHLMIDFETLGVGSFPAVTSFAAVPFDPYKIDNKATLTAQPLYFAKINYEECINRYGMGINLSTLDWWLEQDVNVRKFALGKDPERKDLIRFVNHLDAFIQRQDYTCWCRGTDFDAGILKRIYETLGYNFPFKYDAVMDVRTLLVAVFGNKSPKLLITDKETWNKHNPIDDCVMQILQVQEAYRKLRNVAIA